MAYNTPPTKSSGDTLTAAEWNTYIRDNFAASTPDVFGAKGEFFAASGANTGQVISAPSYDFSIIDSLTTEATGLRWVLYSPHSVLTKTVQNIANDTDTQITGFTTKHDSMSIVSGDTFAVNRTGLYCIQASAYWTGHATNDTFRKLRINVSGDAYGPGDYSLVTAQTDGTEDIDQTFQTICYLVGGAAPVIRLYAHQKSGGSLDLNKIYLLITLIR